MSKVWNVSFAIEGCGSAAVEAENEEEALKKAKSGEFLEEAEIESWDINSSRYRGGYIDVTEGAQ